MFFFHNIIIIKSIQYLQLTSYNTITHFYTYQERSSAAQEKNTNSNNTQIFTDSNYCFGKVIFGKVQMVIQYRAPGK